MDMAKFIEPVNSMKHFFPSWGELTVHLLLPEHMILLFTCAADRTGLTTSSNLGSTF